MLVTTGKWLTRRAENVAAGLLAVMFVAFILCYWAWFKIVSRASAVVSSLGTLLIPVVGVISSMLVLGERPSWHEFAAMALVLAAIATVIIPPSGGSGADCRP